MTNQNETLADKMVDLTGGIEFLENTDFALDVEDVKSSIQKFLKELKTEIVNKTIWDAEFKIDKLALKHFGEKLVEDKI